MNKVKAFWKYSLHDLELDINEFAEEHEIINILMVTCVSGDGYKALVLYKAQ